MDVQSRSVFVNGDNNADCSGTRLVFTVRENVSELDASVVAGRIKPVSNERCVGFLECTHSSSSKFNQTRECRQIMIAYKRGRGNASWYLGIVRKLTLRTQTFSSNEMNRNDGVLLVNRWLGRTKTVDGCCIPDFYCADGPDSCVECFETECLLFKKYSGVKFAFINQFCGVHFDRGKSDMSMQNPFKIACKVH